MFTPKPVFAAAGGAGSSNDAQNDPSKGGAAATEGNQSKVSATTGLTPENTPGSKPGPTTAAQDDVNKANAAKEAATFTQFSRTGTIDENSSPGDLAINKLREILNRMPNNSANDTILFGYAGVLFRTGDLKALFADN